jgi:fibronectin type 3 domain-containing protein
MAVIYDTIPPEIPTGLKAVCDKNGNVHVSWNSSKEQNLSGYKLFRNNSLNEEPAQINSHFIKDTFYNEKLKLNNLSRKVYYAIAATDGNLNTSKLCAFIEVRKPDTLAPIKPILLSIFPHTFGIKLKMNLSEEEDVKEHCIMRKENKFQETEIKNWKREDTLSVYLDSTAIPGRTYSYRLRSSDEDGNRSFSEELSIRYETGFRKKLNDFNVSVDRKRKEILLSWNYNENKIEKFIIYRKKGDGKLTILKTLEGNERAYRDDTPQMGNFYEYRIKAVMEDGVESIISDGVKVEY